MSIKIKALRPLQGDAGTIRRGETADVSAAVAKSLVGRGLAELDGEQPAPRKRAGKGGNRKGAKAPEGN